MNAIIYIYRKEKNYSVKTENIATQIYNDFKNHEIFFKEARENKVLKIRVRNKRPIFKVILKPLIASRIWFAKFPNSEDLLILKTELNNKPFEIYIKKNHWKYRTLELDMILANPETLFSYNKLN